MSSIAQESERRNTVTLLHIRRRMGSTRTISEWVENHEEVLERFGDRFVEWS